MIIAAFLHYFGSLSFCKNLNYQGKNSFSFQGKIEQKSSKTEMKDS